MAERGVGTYEVIREGEDIILRVNYDAAVTAPSLEDSELVMGRIVEILAEIGHVTKIVLNQRRDYEYDYAQSIMLNEIAKIYRVITREGIITSEISDASAPNAAANAASRRAFLQSVIQRYLKSDPVTAYVELERTLRREKIKLEHLGAVYKVDQEKYNAYLQGLIDELGKTALIQAARPYLAGHKAGDREVYKEIFTPIIKPDFMYTRLLAAYPTEGEELARYNVGSTEVTIFRLPEGIRTWYHIIPPEFRLSEEKYNLIDQARRVLSEHQPTAKEFTDPKRMREVFHNIGFDLLEDLARNEGLQLKHKELEELTQILIRYTVGFGLIEVLLQDEQVQDVTINSPMGRIPMFIVHAEYGDCVTNIVPTASEAESWASKLRLISGRPLDEANPIMDTGLVLPKAEARVAVISPPINPYGLAYAFRRHRDKPWTLPLFVKHRMVNSLAAGLLSFLIDGSRTMLVAGTRSAGKTSLLGSLLVEIMRRYRIITIEDTLELPTNSLRNLGYNIQTMKVASALTRGTTEVSASEGIRTTLRLGDSSLIVGEVRSDEARALYEAMRVGALANVVAGTIHGDSPYGVFDRVVNDLNVPRTSFKATDIIVVCNPIRSPDGLHRVRRVTQITEIRKHWEDDPLREGGFVDLMRYDSKTDQLEPTPELINGDSDILKSIAGNVKEWAGNWDAIWENIELRAKMKQTLVDISEQMRKPELLEAEFVLRANDEFHRVSDMVKQETGRLDSEKIFFRWHTWLKRSIKLLELKM